MSSFFCDKIGGRGGSQTDLVKYQKLSEWLSETLSGWLSEWEQNTSVCNEGNKQRILAYLLPKYDLSFSSFILSNHLYENIYQIELS